MINVCWQCGDIGISEALVYCIKCKNAAMHSYCLEEVPEDFSAEINWLCEDCRSKSLSSISKAKFPTPTSLERPQIGPKNPCQDIGSSNDHLVNYQAQHPISNVRIGSSVNLDNHISRELKKASSCAIDDALGTISSSDCFKQNDDGIEEFGYEKLKKEGLMLSDKDNLDDFQFPVEAQDTTFQFAAKRLRGISIEASDKQIIRGASNCDIGGLGAGRSFVCFELKEDEREESEKERTKRRGLIRQVKVELNSFHPLINGEGTNFSLSLKGIPGTLFLPSDSHIIVRTARCTTHEILAVRSSTCYKREEEEIELYEKRESKSRRLILQTNNFHPLIDSQGTSISFVMKKLHGSPVEESHRHSIEGTLRNDTNTLDAVGSSVCFTLKEDEIEEYEKDYWKRRSIVPYKDGLDNFHPVVDGQGTNISFAVERLVCTSIEPSKKILKRTSVGTSTCFEFEGGQIEEQKVKPMIRMIIPGMDQLDDIHPPIEVQGSSIRFAAKRLSGTSIGESDKQTIGSTSRCTIGSLDVVRPSACFGQKEGEIKPRTKKRRRRRRRSNRRTLMSPIKDERDIFHPIIFCQDKNIPVVAKGVPSIPNKTSNKQIIRRIKTSDPLVAMRSSSCFELKKDEIDRYRKDKLERRSLILPTKDELNNLHSFIDRRGTNMKFPTKKLPGTSVEHSDRHTTRWIDTKAQIKPLCQLASPSLPVVSHVWRGCFNINKVGFGPLMAHLSSRACLKVCNLARMLPLVLHMQKLPRLVAWPNSFKVSSPTNDNIALYFFPESDRVENALDELVDDIINNDLMLRYAFDEVELLVFSSFMLPQEHQRIFGKYYPWGVFKPRSIKICSLPVDSHTRYQVGEVLKPVRRSEVEEHDDGIFKYSSQEINDYTLRKSLIQPEEGKFRVTAYSTGAYEEGKLQTLHRKPSGHAEFLWHSEQQHGDCRKKLGLEMSKKFTLEIKEVAEQIKERSDMVNSRQKLRLFRGLEGESWDFDEKFINGA